MAGGIYTSLTGLNRDYRQVYISVSQLCISPSVPLTCLFVCLLVRPDDGAEVGEDQCAESAGSFLWSTVVVKRVLAQHKPVSTLLDPISSHLQQEPPFKTRHIHKSYGNCYTRQQKWDKCLISQRQFLKHLMVTNFQMQASAALSHPMLWYTTYIWTDGAINEDMYMWTLDIRHW